MTTHLLAEFEAAEPMVAALRAAQAAGWRKLDAHAPFPVPEAAKLLGAHESPVGWIAIAAGLAGAALAYGTQWWLSVHAWPINVGGRPLHALPAFLPATTIVGILWAAAGALLGMLALNRLPRLHHPVFAASQFHRASEDRFFLSLELDGPDFDAAAAHRLLAPHRPLSVAALGG